MCKIKLLAWDLGVTNHGLALFHFDESYIKLIKAEYIQVLHKDFSEKLFWAKHHFTNWCDLYNPDILAFERPVFKKGNMGSQLDQVLGVITLEMFLREIPIYGFSASSVKKTMCQNGRAGKKDIEKAVNKMLKINYKFERDHASDAAAVGLSYYIKHINPDFTGV